MAIATWPAALRPREWSLPELDKATLGGGQTIGGAEDIVAIAGGRWRRSLSFDIRNTETLRAWNLLRAVAGTKDRIIRVPLVGCMTQPGSRLFTAFDDTTGTTFFDDGFGFVEEVEAATLAEAASLNATTVTVASAMPFQVGDYIGLRDRLHHITDAAPVSAGVRRFTIRPWLREALPAGEPVLSRTAVCRMRLVDDAPMRTPLSLGRFASITLDYQEA